MSFKCDKCGALAFQIDAVTTMYNTTGNITSVFDSRGCEQWKSGTHKTIYEMIATCKGCFKQWGPKESLIEIEQLLEENGVT
jgi:hypothetical protein